MVKDAKLLEQFENDLIRGQKPDYETNMRLFEAMYNEAVAFGVLPTKNPLEGIEFKIDFVKRLHQVQNVPTGNSNSPQCIIK